MFNAVKEVILSHFNDVKIDAAISNELIGQKTRAKLDGIKTVEDAFRKLAGYKTGKEKITINEAR